MNSNAVILPATAAHVAEIAALAQIVWRANYPGIISNEQIEYMLARMYDLSVMQDEITNGMRYDRLLLDDQLVGFSSYGPVSATELKLHKLYIHPQHQRQGFGGLLLEQVFREAQRLGFASLILSVNKANTDAIAAYKKNGFTIREAVVVDIGGGFVMDDFVMEKAL